MTPLYVADTITRSLPFLYVYLTFYTRYQIPWFPIVKKDMTFLHLGNETRVDGLINFEKLRMIAKEVRRVCKFCAIGYVSPNSVDYFL